MNQELNFRLMEETDAEEVLQLLAQSFCTYDPMEAVMGITEAEFIQMARLDLPQIFQDKLSLGLRDEATNKLICASAVLDATTKFADSTGKISPKFDPIAAIVNQLHHPYRMTVPNVRGQTAYIYMGAVSPEWQGKGIAKSLFKAIETFVVSRGYQSIFTISTNVGSYIALQKNHYKDISSIAYKEFIYQTEKIFTSIHEHPGLTLMERNLR
jgi:ribosomal protein S18 acetylase RimI-like enzyme